VISPSRLAVIVLLASGCERQPEPESRPAPPKAASPAPEAPSAGAPPAVREEASAARLQWKDPPGWERTPVRSAMRLATYRVPKTASDTDDAELTVFHFGAGQGGSIESNLARWEKQFTNLARPAARRERTVKGMAVHVLEVESGTFGNATMPGLPSKAHEAWGLLAAIVETPGGPYFFKLTGPAKTCAAGAEKFFALIDGLAFST